MKKFKHESHSYNAPIPTAARMDSAVQELPKGRTDSGVTCRSRNTLHRGDEVQAGSQNPLGT